MKHLNHVKRSKNINKQFSITRGGTKNAFRKLVMNSWLSRYCWVTGINVRPTWCILWILTIKNPTRHFLITEGLRARLWTVSMQKKYFSYLWPVLVFFQFTDMRSWCFFVKSISPTTLTCSNVFILSFTQVMILHWHKKYSLLHL